MNLEIAIILKSVKAKAHRIFWYQRAKSVLVFITSVLVVVLLRGSPKKVL